MRPFDSIGPEGTTRREPSAPPPRDGRSRRTAGVLAVALAGTLIGGAAGGVAATRWMAMQAPTAPLATSAPSSTTPAASNGQTTASAVYERVKASVVELVVLGQSSGGSGNGSGFVIDERGYILTNNHVVANARAISVRFSDGQSRQAQVVGTDRGNDLALLKVDLPAGVPAVALGDSDRVQVGEVAIAIGSPFGLEQTLTQGIISAVNRTYQSGNGPARRNLIQTDAPINPGNSGGPLLNDRAEVIGINSMIESPVQGSVGIGFAVPINLAKQLLPQLEAGARLEPVWLGISGVALDATIAADQGLTIQSGVLVTSVVAGGPAARAGLRGGQPTNEPIPRGGDVITAVDGIAVSEVTQISERLAGRKPGDTVRLTIVRGGAQLEVTVTLQAWPAGTN